MITRWTSLPNAHPALVHFPIALLPISLLLEVVGLIRARPWWASRAAAFLLVVAAVLTFVALEAGEDAADGLLNVTPVAQKQIGLHHDAAEWALRVTILALLLRLAVALHGRRNRSWNRAERGLAALATAGATVMVFWAADLGGQLVYRYGLAVQRIEREAAPVSGVEGRAEPGAAPQAVSPAEVPPTGVAPADAAGATPAPPEAAPAGEAAGPGTDRPATDDPPGGGISGAD